MREDVPVTRTHRSRRTAPTLAVAALVAALAACSGGGASDDDSPGADAAGAVDTSTASLAFAGCDAVECEGTLDGARYRILTPTTWNGTLLLYSHGYRFAEPVPPTFDPPATDAVPAPGEDVAQALLAKGYALAGSSYSSNGWAVQEGVRADERLYQFFAEKVGKPRRVYLWGDSLGGLVTQTLAEKDLPWVSGAAPLCGVLGGTNANLDVALDVAYGVKRLVLPSLVLTGYTSHRQAVQQFDAAQKAIVAQASASGDGPAKVALLSAIVDAPDQTSRFDGSTPVSRISAAVEAAVTGLGYGTYGRYEIEQRVGGNPSGNAEADYAARVSDSERQLVDLVGGPGATDRLLARLSAGRVEADPAARKKADALGRPTGDLTVPTLTVHTTDDPLVLVQNERLFGDRVRAAGQVQSLRQLYVAPPATFTAPAPYGAGHCNFTVDQRLTTIDLLDQWVRSGEPLTGSVVHRATSAVEGFSAGFTPTAWPAADLR